MNTYTKQKDGTIAVLIRNEWKPATTTRNKHGILQALSADGKQWEDLPAAFQEQQAPAARDYQKPLGIPFTPGKIPDQVAPFPAYPGTTAQPGIKTTQPETEYQKSMGGLVSAGVKGLGSGFAVEAPRSAVNVASGAARINRSMLARLGYKTDQAKYEQELSQASALPAASARERMVKEGELERLKAGKPEEPIIEKVYNFVQELTEVTAEQPWLKADIENMTQMERDVYSGLRSLPVSLGAGAAGAVTVAAAGLTGVPLAVGAGVSTLVIMGLSAGEDFVRNWEKQAETDPKLKAIVEKLAKEENIPFDEAKQDMFDQMEINKKGVYYGLSEAIPEALGNLVMFWTAGFGKPLAAVIKTGARSVLKTGAKLIGAGSVEIGTELVTGTLQRGIEEKAGLPVEPMEKMLRDTFGSTLIMTIASAGLLKGTNLAMRYNMAEKAGIKPTDAPATMENIPDIPTTPEAKAQTSRELRRAANEIKASDPKRAEDIEIIAAFQENISDMSAEERADIVTSMMTRQGRTVAQGIVDKQNKLEQAHADIEKEKTTGRTDYLTKINSRRGLEAARTVDHTQAIIFDIDLFKKVNDTFGHPVGDVVLKDVADRAQAIAKKYGAAVGRIGGEEFVLLVPQGQDAAVISEEIRAEMEARPSEAFDKEVPFTVSVGYAPVDATGDAWATADKKMYEAKQAGRNQVMGVDAAPAEEGEGTLQKTSKFVSQAVEAGVDPEVAEATRILGEAFAKATGISVDKVLPQITTEAPGAGMLAQREAQINSPEFKKWFGKSQVVDKDGKPMVVYHGTYIKKDFDSFKPFSYFTDSPEGADSYTLRRLADKKIGYRPRIYPGYLSIENPLDLTHFGLDKNSLIPHNSGSLLNFLKTNESDLRNAILKTQSNPNFNTWRKEISGLPLFDESKDIPSKWVSDDVISAQHVWEQRGGLLPDAVLIGTRENINPVLGDILKNLGYDGIILPDYEVITSGKQGDYKQIKAFVNFSPTQIKSATGNRGTFSPTDANILHQEAQAAEPFYSKLRKVIADKMPNSATIEAINGLIAGAGVKNDELTWSGVKDFLEGKEKVSKAELLDYLDKNPVEDISQKKPLPEAKEVSVDYVSETGDKYTEKLLEVPMESAYVREQRDQTTWTKWHKDLAKESKKEGPATSGRKFAYTSAGEVLVETGPKTDNRVPGVLSGDTERKSQMIVGLSSVEEINKYMDEIFGTEAELDAIQDAGRTTRKLELADIFRSDLEYAARERDIKSLMAGLAEIKYLFASDAKNHYTLFQKAGPAIQGAITFDAGKALIHVLKTANASTLPHELAHNFLKLGTEAKYFNDTEIKAMTDFGVLDKNGTITRPGQEKFARSFERYLRDGQSPSEHLKAIFDKFKAWLQEVYAQLQGSAIDIKLTPEIKGIFDRMLGVEARGEPATFLFWQENGQGEPVFPLYNLNVDIPGHGKGSTVSGETLKKAGIILPEPPKHGQMESPLITEAKEPWQMTRGEFIKIYKHPLADIKDIKINKLHRIKPLTESEIDRYDVLRISENSVEERAELHRLQNKEKGVIGLPEIIKSNELYKKYPFLKHVLVGFNNRITGMRATGNNIDVGRDAWKDSGLLLHEVIHVIQKESGIYSLTPPTKNVKTINDFTLAEEESWWNNPKEKEARSTQYILSGKYDNKIAGQSIHKSLIKQALASGKPVPAEVLAGYPDLKAKAQKPFTAPPRGEQTPQAAIPPKQGKIAQPAPVMQAPEGIQQDITAPKPEPSKIRNFFYGNYGATMPMPVEPLTRKRINKLAILDFVEKNFGVYVRDRATMKFEEGVAGKHYPEQHIIRLKFWGELEPMMHEIGHELNSKLGSVLGENWKKPFSKELGQMDYDKEQGRPEEGFAEFMRKYFTGDQTLEDTAPTFYDFFIQAIEKIPPWNTRINGLREQLDTWQQQGSDARFDAMIDPSPPVNLKQAVKDAWRKFYKMWVTAGEPFDYMEKQLKTAGITLEPENSPAQLRTYFNKKTKSKAYLWTFDGQYDPLDPSVKLGPSLSEIIIKAGIRSGDDLTKFVRYGTARRVMERYEAHGLEAGFDVNDAEYVKGKYQNSLWDAALDDITKWNGNLLRLYLLKPGLISEEQLTQIRAMNPMYLPMKRIMDNKERYGISSGKGLESGSGIKRVKGGSRPVMNFLKAMSEQMQGIMARGEKAYLGMSLINLEEQKPGLGIIVNVLAPTQVTRAHIDQAKVSFEKDGVQVAEKKLSETFNYDDVIEALTVQGIEATEGDLDAILTIFTQAPTYNGKDNIIPLWKEGKQKFYELNENLYSGISSMSAQYKWPFLEFVRKGGSMFSRALRLGATGLNAAFSLVTNPILRDPITYAIFSQKKFATPFDVIPTNLKRLGAFGGKTENMLRAERSGLGMSNFLGMDRNLVYDEILLRTNKTFYGKAFVKIRHPIEFFKEAFSWGESGPRLTEYENVYKQNLKDHPEWSSASQNIEATNAGQDVTVNFTRGSDAAFAINEQAAFFNVAIQGPEKLIRELKNNPVRTVTRGIAYLTIMGIWNYLNNRDKEWYENLPLSYRYNNLWWEVGGTVYHTPLPFELGTIFVALPCAAMETMRLKRPDDFKAAVQLFISQIPDPMPTLPAPLIDIMRNKDWLGNPIENEDVKRFPITERKKYYTTDVAAAASKGFNKLGIKLSPIQIDYLFNSWTGGITKNFPDLDIKETADIPIIGRYVLRMPENPRRQLEDYFTAEQVINEKDAFAKAIDAELTDAEEDRLDDIKNFRKSWTEYYAKDLIEYSSAMSTGDKTAHAKLVKTYREIREHLSDIGFK